MSLAATLIIEAIINDKPTTRKYRPTREDRKRRTERFVEKILSDECRSRERNRLSKTGTGVGKGSVKAHSGNGNNQNKNNQYIPPMSRRSRKVMDRKRRLDPIQHHQFLKKSEWRELMEYNPYLNK